MAGFEAETDRKGGFSDATGGGRGLSVTAAVELEDDMVGAGSEGGLGVGAEAGTETVDEAEAGADDKAGADGNSGAGSETDGCEEFKAGDGAAVGGES